ncbi:MAG: MFS transporter [Nitrospiria bacterium]
MRSALALTAFYFASFAALGIFLPYFNLYLLHAGFSSWQIGVIAAIPPLLKIVVPAFFGLAADRSGARRTLIVGTSAATTLAFALLLGVTSFGGVLAVMIVFALAWAPVLPLVEATALETVDRWPGLDYGRIRLWGSVGFIAATTGMGILLDYAPDRVILYGVLAAFIATTAAAFGLPAPTSPPGSTPIGLGSILRRSPLPLFYLACLLMQFSHGAYYGFFSIALEAEGWSTSSIGALWTVGVVAEIALMFWSGRVLARFGAELMFVASFVAAALRWTVMAFPLHLPGLILAQCLHAFSFGAFHIAAVTIIHQAVPASLRATGQTLYSSLAYGLGSALGLLISGWLYASWGPQRLFGLSAAAAGLGLVLAIGVTARGIRRPASE